MVSIVVYKRKRALVIGIDKYARDPLNYCVNDADDLREVLEDIHFHVTFEKDCELALFYRKIDQFTDELQPEDLAIIYLAGHGKQYNDENYLLPVDYCFDFGGSERDYIKTNAINVNYITKRLVSKKCAAVIYLFDCCRSRIHSGTSRSNEGLSKIDGLRQTLIVFGCAPGGAVQDETRNDRNGSFMENLLEHIKRPNTDIEEIMKDVSDAVSLQTRGFQVPYRSSSIVGKVFLVPKNDKDTPKQPKIAHQPKHKLLGRNNDSFTYARKQSDDYPDSVSDDESVSSKSQRKPSYSGNSPQSIRDVTRLKSFNIPLNRPLLLDINDEESSEKTKHTTSQSSIEQKADENRPISPSIRIREHNQKKIRISGESDKEIIDDKDIPCVPEPSVRKHSETVSEDTTEEESFESPRSTSDEEVDETNDVSLNLDDTKSLTVRICTLCRSYCIEIPQQTSMKEFINAIWHKIEFCQERYSRNTHTILLFNHRLHIFVESDRNALVKDFLLLSPPMHSSQNNAVDFYVYGLPEEYDNSMYQIDDDKTPVFGNSYWWCPFHFNEYKQLERPQSVFLSSLFALRLYFRPENAELKVERMIMEAEFFRELRKYLFPPAILALKHTIDGFIFTFEKALLMDSLIQLLNHLCDPNKIDTKEICDFIPLLICWILENCDPNSIEEDYFLNVTLINNNKLHSTYFQDPVTTSTSNRQALLLEEFDDKHDYEDLKHHVDIRSLTSYLSNSMKTSRNTQCQCDVYIIYDPREQNIPDLKLLKYWTDTEVKELYRIIAHKNDYRSFSIITRGAVTNHTRNQLILLEKDRTVGLLVTSKNEIRSDAKTPRDMNHFFQIFDPLSCTKDNSYRNVKPELILDEKQHLPDPRLPLHFNTSLKINITHADALSNDIATNPTRQATIILLDRSRSMSDYRVPSYDKVKNCSHIDICKIMLARLSDNIRSINEVYAIGLIQFETKYKTLCPITPNHEKFDRALSLDECGGEWTCMYDAIHEAIRQINVFTKSPIRAHKDCKKLIICFSDGIDNYSKVLIKDVKRHIEKSGIVMDFISFINDNELKTQEDIVKVKQTRRLCIDSGGYVYKDLKSRSDIELASIFEQEAAIWLSKRSTTKSGIIDKPERDIPLAFSEPAIHRPLLNENMNNSICVRRILNEYNAINRRPLADIIVFIVRENIAFWKVSLKGPSNTPYANRFWMLYIQFDQIYPNCAPDVRFFTPIYHVNINGDGKICHQILNRNWHVKTNMSTIFENIVDLLKVPNFDDAMSLEKAHLYKENPAEYNRQATAHANKHAMDSIEMLKNKHQLQEDCEETNEQS
ncbi:hypothetical protein I4U23_020191 [Adineta vaga]|nr:hypothetical protein I4U23_020191 [Adineta vaga]